MKLTQLQGMVIFLSDNDFAVSYFEHGSPFANIPPDQQEMLDKYTQMTQNQPKSPNTNQVRICLERALANIAEEDLFHATADIHDALDAL
jgi:hypothetical protein